MFLLLVSTASNNFLTLCNFFKRLVSIDLCLSVSQQCVVYHSCLSHSFVYADAVATTVVASVLLSATLTAAFPFGTDADPFSAGSADPTEEP